MTSPLVADRTAAMTSRLAREAEGRPLAVYAAIRSTGRVPNALLGLGLPLVAFVLDSLDDEPTRVTAVTTRHSADSPVWGLGTEVEQWTILIRCRSELTITVDVAAGPWTTGAGPLELRVEWMTSERVTTFYPRGASIASAAAGDASLGLSGLEEALLAYAEELGDLEAEGAMPEVLHAALRIVDAARESAEVGTSIDMMADR